MRTISAHLFDFLYFPTSVSGVARFLLFSRPSPPSFLLLLPSSSYTASCLLAPAPWVLSGAICSTDSPVIAAVEPWQGPSLTSTAATAAGSTVSGRRARRSNNMHSEWAAAAVIGAESPSRGLCWLSVPSQALSGISGKIGGLALFRGWLGPLLPAGVGQQVEPPCYRRVRYVLWSPACRNCHVSPPRMHLTRSAQVGQRIP